METTTPNLSIVIPVGEAHIELVKRAIYSVLVQAGVSYELIVVNDTDKALNLPGNPKIIQGRMRGPAAARNDGAEVATGECFVWLDADDVLMPGSLKALWQAYQEHKTIVYGITVRSDNQKLHKPAPQYCGDDLKKTCLYTPKRMPTHLVPAWMHHEIGGFDELAPLWEDVIYEIDMDIRGFCAETIEYPIYLYSMDTGTRRKDERLTDEAKHYIKLKYKDYFSGRKKMACGGGCGGGKAKPIALPSTANTTGGNQVLRLFNTHYLELEFIGNNPDVKTFIGPITKQKYRFGNTKTERQRKKPVGYEIGSDKNNAAEVHPDDAAEFVRQPTRDGGPQFRINKLGERVPVEKKQPAGPKVKQLEVKVDEAESTRLKAQVWASLPVSRFTLKELKDAADAVPVEVLTRWLQEEQEGESPRKTVIEFLEKFIGVEEAPDLPDGEPDPYVYPAFSAFDDD